MVLTWCSGRSTDSDQGLQDSCSVRCGKPKIQFGCFSSLEAPLALGNTILSGRDHFGVTIGTMTIIEFRRQRRQENLAL